MQDFQNQGSVVAGCRESFPLALVSAGEDVCIFRIGGGKTVQDTCAQQGLLLGHAIKLMQKNAGGACVVEVMGSRIMLGADISRRIVVQRLA